MATAFFESASELLRRAADTDFLTLVAQKVGAVTLVLFLASVGYGLLARLLRRALTPGEGAAGYERKLQRAQTMVPLLRSIGRYVVYFVAGVAILQQFGIDATAVVASAGVVGLAVGFGAQSLVKDLISGFFLLFEGLIAVGDIVTVGGHTGVVEAIGIRVTQVRKFDGELRVIPNGEITSFGHLKRDWARAVVTVGIAYEKNFEEALQVLARVARGWAEQNEMVILEPPEVQGMLAFGDSDCQARVVTKVKPGEQWACERSLRRSIKKAFDDANVEIPFPRRVVYLREEKAVDDRIRLVAPPVVEARVPPPAAEPNPEEELVPEGQPERAWSAVTALAGRFAGLFSGRKGT